MFFIRRFSQKIYMLATILFVTGASAATPFSQYGMIQNVQNYANNPFYNNGTAQITTPRIVYATGPALTPNDCLRTVQSIVENVCFQNNYCKTTTLADVRPKIMVQLSSLPGHNYASSCAGYIDTIYEKYQKNALNSASVQNISSFPTAPSKQNNTNTNTYAARAAELKSLQNLNPIDTTVNDADFPTTLRDLSITEYTNLQRDNLAEYMDKSAYTPLNIIREEKTAGTTPGKTFDGNNCQAVYNCISQIGDAERAAETNWFNARQKYTTNPSSENHESLKQTATALENAWKRALLSPCLCTQNADYLRAMNMKDLCDKDDTKRQNWINEKIQEYKNKTGL